MAHVAHAPQAQVEFMENQTGNDAANRLEVRTKLWSCRSL